MFLLHSLQSPINIGMILRSAEAYGQSVVICDTHNVVEDNLSTIADFACGALGRRPPIVETCFEACQPHVKGRLLATGFDQNAVPLNFATWKDSDCIVFGNEYEGLPRPVLDLADAQIWVPMPSQKLPKPTSASPIDPSRTEGVSNNGQPTLNVAATAVIIAHNIYMSNNLTIDRF